jgi:hypothetical protein
VVDGKHLLVGDDAEKLARACLLLKDNPTLGDALAEQAAGLLAKCYSAFCIDAAIGAIYD